MKILWLDINSSYSHSSLALPALHAQIIDKPISKDCQWSVVRGSLKSNQSDIIEKTINESPDIILSTLWLFTHEYVMSVMTRIKSLIPDVTIVLGGPEFLGENKSFLIKNDFVDAVFRGEGEEFLEKWLPFYAEKDKWNEIGGLCYFYENEYHDNGKAIIYDFASLKYPEDSQFFVNDRSFVQLETTRGCFNSCRFCVSGTDKPVRSQSLEQIRERIEHFKNMGIKHVRLLDRTFNGNNRRSIAMLNMMKEYSGELAFHLEMHPSLLNDVLREEFQKMPAGLLHLEAGIQSLRQNVLDACTRNGNVESALSGLDFLFSLSDKMETHTDLIAGLPLYTYNELVEDTRTLVMMNSGEVQLETLKVLPGTEMRRLADELGLRYSKLPPYEILQTPHITFTELRRSMLLSRLLDVYYNHSPWRTLFREIVSFSSDSLEECVDYFWNLNEEMFNISLEREAKLLYGYLKEKKTSLVGQFIRIWIEKGLNLNNLPELVKVLPMQSFLEQYYPSLSQKDRGRHRCYDIVTNYGEWIVIYDRAVSQNIPSVIIDKSV